VACGDREMSRRPNRSPARSRAADDESTAMRAVGSAASASGSRPDADDNESRELVPELAPAPPALRRSATEEGLTCGICLNVMCEPVTLQCGHTLCKACFVRHLETIDPEAMHLATGSAICPVARCLVPFEVPETSVALKAAIESRHSERLTARNDLPDAAHLAQRVAILRMQAVGFGATDLNHEERLLLAQHRLRDLGMLADLQGHAEQVLPAMLHWGRSHFGWLLQKGIYVAGGAYTWSLAGWLVRRLAAYVAGRPQWAASLYEAIHLATRTSWAAFHIIFDWVCYGAMHAMALYAIQSLFSQASRGWLSLHIAGARPDEVVGVLLGGTAFCLHHMALDVQPGALTITWLPADRTSVRMSVGLACSLVAVALEQRLIVVRRAHRIKLRLGLWAAMTAACGCTEEFLWLTSTLPMLISPTMCLQFDLSDHLLNPARHQACRWLRGLLLAPILTSSAQWAGCTVDMPELAPLHPLCGFFDAVANSSALDAPSAALYHLS